MYRASTASSASDTSASSVASSRTPPATSTPMLRAHHVKPSLLFIRLEPFWECLVCKHTLSSAPGMANHMLKHTGERPYKCHLCPYKSTRRNKLNDHIQSLHPTAIKVGKRSSWPRQKTRCCEDTL
ncbi:hypothetical protein MRX96_044390 [Rhipicephalus microplus]